MGYQHILNLYKDPTVLMFRRLYASEKIHGTSAHVAWRDKAVYLFSGGVSEQAFAPLFDTAKLASEFEALGHEATPITVYGEAFGGKCQGMSATYGKALRFLAFEVQIGEFWLSVPQAADVAAKLGLGFVPYVEIDATEQAVNAERDADSLVAIAPGKMREGVVLRPLIELTKNNGERVIAKHKRPEFSETVTPREIGRLGTLTDAEAIALEWVTPRRLEHVLAALGIQEAPEMRHTPQVVRAMTEDVRREAAGEIVESKEAAKAIGHQTVKLFKALVTAGPPS